MLLGTSHNSYSEAARLLGQSLSVQVCVALGLRLVAASCWHVSHLHQHCMARDQVLTLLVNCPVLLGAVLQQLQSGCATAQHVFLSLSAKGP